MKKRIASMLILLATVALGACDKTEVFLTAPAEQPVTQTDTATKVALPPFMSQAISVPIDSNTYGMSISFYAPQSFEPDYSMTSSNTGVVIITSTYMNKSSEYDANGIQGRAIWTINVDFRAINVGNSTIMLKLNNGGTPQSSSFQVTTIGTKG